MVPGVKLYEELVRNSSWSMGHYPDAIGREEEWLANLMHAHRTADSEIETLVLNDKWVLMTERRMTNGGIAGLRIDITALKEAQAALRESEVRLDRAQAIAGIGDWELDLATGRYIWSKELYRIRGLSPETFQPDIDNVAAYVHAEDYRPIRRWITDLMAGLDQGVREARIVRPDGVVRLLRVEGRAVTDVGRGRSQAHAGTMQDITERRLIRSSSSRSHRRWKPSATSYLRHWQHDFNNWPGCAIIGNLDLLERMVAANGTATEVCDEAREAALHCADLSSAGCSLSRGANHLSRVTSTSMCWSRISSALVEPHSRRGHHAHR